jgi:tetratricopeptide (TPR) repeat protein
MPISVAPSRQPLRSIACGAALLLCGWLGSAPPSRAQDVQPAGAAESAAPPANSALDAPLFYQLLIGELELRGGQAGSAYEIILDAARRTRDEALFRRAVDIALAARAGDQALAASRAWRSARPQSLEALRVQLQIMVAMNRSAEIGEPLRALLAQTPAAERGATIASLPRFLQRAGEPRAIATLIEDATRPYSDAPGTRTPVLVAVGRAWLAAADPARALALARAAAALEPAAPGPALLAMELVRDRPEAESIVTAHLAQPQAEHALRLAWVRVLTGAQRYADAIAQLEIATRAQPQDPQPLLTLGALHLELRHPEEAEAALRRFVELAEKNPRAPAAAGAPDEDGEDDGPTPTDRALVQAWLMLAQAAEQRGDFAAAERWLARIDDPQRALDVLTRRASMLVRQGQLAQARELVRSAPERRPEDARAKLVAEVSLLREARRWQEAYELLGTAVQRFPDDGDLLYEQAMMAEKRNRIDEMERLLRRVMALRPDNAHAYNALGYSLADRGQRLDEAKKLIVRALDLAPGDPFITDSLGWVEYRLGNREEALQLLRRAWDARPDPEIGAHLGEVLWSLGRKDEARSVWRDSRRRDAANEVLRETLARLRVDL